jgi:hypothetical protein
MMAKSNPSSGAGNMKSKSILPTWRSKLPGTSAKSGRWKVSFKTQPDAGTRVESVNWKNSMDVTIGQPIGWPPTSISKIGLIFPR